MGLLENVAYVFQ